MDLIYIVVGAGEYAPMAESEVRSRLASGQLSLETYFWKEGMPDWLPLAQLPPPPKPPPSIIPPQKPLHVAPGHDYIRPTANRLKSTYPIALGRRIADYQEPLPQPLVSDANSVALPRRTTPQTSWNPAPRAVQQPAIHPQAAAPAPSSNPVPAYAAPEAPFETPKPRSAPPFAPEEPAVGVVVTGPIASPQYFAREDLEPMSWITIAMFGLCFLSGLLCLYYDLKHYRLLSGTYTFEQESDSSAQIDLVNFIANCIILGAVIPFLIWVYRVSENCHGFIPGTRYTTGWTLASFFIPVFNLFRPLLGLQEIWKVSKHPLGWADRRGSLVVAGWGVLWAAYLIMLVVVWYAGSLNGRADDEMLAIEIDLVCCATYVCLSFAAACMVFAISRRQKQLVAIH